MNININTMEDLLYWYSAHVDRIIDGDTVVFSDLDLGFELVFKNKHGRLLGINAPELHAKDEETRFKANVSKEYLASRLTGQDVIIHSKEVDDFGRILCDVYLKEEYINQTILAEGYAVVFEPK
ncbi:thermonuclease family protein [Priestia megaterium]|uniref:thermonuclease family protein n=1 Tax=Priestia megaterium TaxID=1404 RepID=UPI002FFFEBBB